MEILDTIVALATPRQTSAIAAVRLSGPQSLEVLQRLIRKEVTKIESNKATLCNLYSDRDDSSSLIDQALITVFRAPRSYTGEDTVEFYIHGSVDIADDLIRACIDAGARAARPGEFTMKAAVNGKVSLPQAEAIDALIRASSTSARKLALQGVRGETTKGIEDIKSQILEAVAEAEYCLEDDISDRDDKEVLAEVEERSLPIAERTLNLVQAELDRAEKGRRINRGITVAIYGEPNVGKSTLLNALLGQDRAIVTPIPGTTRDVVQGSVEIGGILFTFLDTAGIRETQDPVESIGVKKAKEAAESADVILLVSDSNFSTINKNDLKEFESKPIIRVGSKQDLVGDVEGAEVETSGAKGQIEDLKKKLLDVVKLSDTSEAICLSDRDITYLTRLKENLSEGIRALKENGYIDAFSDMLQRGIRTLDEMLGNSKGQSGEDIYSTIFSHFCLGK